jgi:ribulose-phosphate 3-epimerase
MDKENSLKSKIREICPTISVGITAGDLMNLEGSINALEGAGVRMLHFDVMDGHFCPMLTAGPFYIKNIKTRMLKDVHLMINNPLDQMEQYIKAGADMITIHYESTIHIHRALQMISELAPSDASNSQVIKGVALNPGTPWTVLEPLMDELDMIVLLAVNPGWGGQKFIPSTGDKMMAVRELARKLGKDILLAIDGGISLDNIREISGLKPDIVVTGSAVFKGGATAENARFMMDAMTKYRNTL